MLQRFLTILLVPIFVVGNSFAHCHDTAAHSPGLGRAHFHFGSDSHHRHHQHGTLGHSHDHDSNHGQRNDNSADGLPSCCTTPVDHDSDAIYLAAVDYWFSTAQQNALELDGFAVTAIVEDHRPILQRAVWLDLQRQTHASGPPLYLLHAVLRL